MIGGLMKIGQINKKWWIITVVLLIIGMLSDRFYQHLQQQKAMARIDQDLLSLFQPVLEGIRFVVNGEKFLLVAEKAKLQVNKDDYLTKTEAKALINFNVYRDRVSLESLIGSAWFSTDVRKLDTNRFIIYKSSRSNLSFLAELFSAFAEVYYDYAVKPGDWTEGGAQGYFDEDRVVYDQTGSPSNRVPAHYRINIYRGANPTLILTADFISKPLSEKQEIIVRATKEDEEVTLEAALSEYIIRYQKSRYTPSDVQFEAHKLLGKEAKGEKIHVYLDILYRGYVLQGDELKQRGGGHVPAVIVLQKDPEGRYIPLEYKEPLAGAAYAQSLRNLFPSKIADDILRHHQEYAKELDGQIEVKVKQWIQSVGLQDVGVEK